MFCYIMQTSRRIRIVLVLFLNQSHVLWFFFPLKYWLAIKLAFRLNVIYIKHLLVQSVIQWLFYYYTNSRALGCVPALKEGKGLSFKISYLIILQFLFQLSLKIWAPTKIRFRNAITNVEYIYSKNIFSVL